MPGLGQGSICVRLTAPHKNLSTLPVHRSRRVRVGANPARAPLLDSTGKRRKTRRPTASRRLLSPFLRANAAGGRHRAGLCPVKASCPGVVRWRAAAAARSDDVTGSGTGKTDGARRCLPGRVDGGDAVCRGRYRIGRESRARRLLVLSGDSFGAAETGGGQSTHRHTHTRRPAYLTHVTDARGA